MSIDISGFFHYVFIRMLHFDYKLITTIYVLPSEWQRSNKVKYDQENGKDSTRWNAYG
jgi:hypothetical protein